MNGSISRIEAFKIAFGVAIGAFKKTYGSVKTIRPMPGDSISVTYTRSY